MLNIDTPWTSTIERAHGAQLLPDDLAVFRIWSPAQTRMRISISDRGGLLTLHSHGDGWHELTASGLRAGTRYTFVLEDGTRVPDPASCYQPEGVHGPSELVDPNSYQWCTKAWRGRPWHTAVVYELHVGTFTPEGTFRGAIGMLDHLVSLGVTAIQLMPVAAFPGQRNWGYDGVFPYACASAYGHPDDLKRLVDEAHARGLMVLLDVVYNHFGPEGNYLSLYAPQFFTDRHKTPWGAGINFDGPESRPVREFFIQNAIRWVTEFRLDGLRLDAVHAIIDDSPRHFLDELADRVRRSAPDRFVHLVLENEENQASRLTRNKGGQPKTFTAQWNDDVHHVLHVAATGEACGYYEDYSRDTQKLGRALAEGFAFQGEMMSFRGSPRGEPSRFLPPDAFVSFIQNHDQVGNRALGDRLTTLAPAEACRAVASVYLLLPQIPMIFMGEEWGTRQPFPFFCDFEGDLANAVRDGRRKEFSHLPEFSDPQSLKTIPDPLSESTFRSAVLRWSDVPLPDHQQWLEWYRRVLAVRKAEISPLIASLSGDDAVTFIRGPSAVTVQWLHGAGRVLRLDANLSSVACRGWPAAPSHTLWLEGKITGDELAPWTVRWTASAK